MYYFYDLSMLDIRGELTTALSILYYGNEYGVFNESSNEPLDLGKTFAIRVNVKPREGGGSGNHNSYALMFFERNWNQEVWSKKLLAHRHCLKTITTRVQLCTNSASKPVRENHLFTRSNRYIDFAEYPERALCNTVPAWFVSAFNERFVGYIMRSKRSFADVREVLRRYQLTDVVDHQAHPEGLQSSVNVSAYVMGSEEGAVA